MKEAKENLNKEIVLYPESKVFIDRILNLFTEVLPLKQKSIFTQLLMSQL